MEVLEIKGNCFYYKSTMTVNTKIERIDGKLCKEEEKKASKLEAFFITLIS